MIASRRYRAPLCAALVVLAAGPLDAHAAPVVHSEIGETRACLPISGGALVGTAGGLVKLDDRGQVRGVWTASDGLPGTRIEMISKIGGEIWVGGDTGVARVVVGDQLTSESRYAGHPVRDVLRVGTTTYVATWGGGVRRLAPRGEAVPYAVASKRRHRSNVLSLAHHDGVVYAGTADGLFRIANGKLEGVALPGPAALAIAALFSDGATLWIGTPVGLYARDAKTTRHLGGGDIRRIMKLDGELVVASVGDGLARIDRGRFATLAGAPRGFAMAQAIAEANGAVCTGGLDGTWLRPRGGSWLAARTSQRNRPPSNDISALAYDGKRLWLGTFDRGLAVLEHPKSGSPGVWRTISAETVDTRINALHVDAKANRVWAATASGLYSIDADTGRAARFARGDGLPSRSVLSLAGMRDGRLLVGTSAGAAIIGAGRPVRLAKGQDLGNVWAVAEDATGALWLGTTTGLYRGSETGTEWKRFSLATGHLRDDWVTAIALTGTTLYAGTYHGGVTRFDLGEAVTATQLGDGWINPAGLLVDDGRVLAATMDGLVSGDGKTPGWTTQARMPGKDVTAVVRAGATLFVATRRGLAVL